jgi:hypothetical protein
MEKLLLMLIAAELTNASVGSHANDELKSVQDPDPDITSPTLKARNLEVWEVFRIYYAGVQKALADDQDWPAPQLSVAGLVGSVLNPSTISGALPAIAGLIPQAKPIVDAATALLGQPKTAPRPLPGPIPNPGDKAK